MIDTRSRLAFLRLELPVRDFLVDRFEVAAILSRRSIVGLGTVACVKECGNLRGFSARVVYNGVAGSQKEAA
jgi:hypothetical protein